MAKLAFILLAHEAADLVINAADALLQADDTCMIALHYDRKSSAKDFGRLKDHYRGEQRVFIVENRIACGWGEFGLVEATVKAMQTLHASGTDYSHAYLVSTSCFPIKPLASLRAFLDARPDTDFIESQDESWIKGGLRDERYRFYFPFSFVRQRGLFEFATALQRRLGIRRKRPKLTPRYGSQWWCLRRATVEGVLGWIDAHPADFGFFRQVWIPDETFFQTIVPMVEGAKPSGDWIPTLVTFNAFGKPVVLYDDHRDWLAQQPFFLARKMAPTAKLLRREFGAATIAAQDAEVILQSPPSMKLPMPRLPVERGYGRIFDPASAVRDWKKNLSVIGQPFVVLYGPPQLTGLAREMLASKPGLQVHGRLFDPNVPQKLSRAKREAIQLRDYDRALYLSELFSAGTGLPVFELCPGDDAKLDKALLDDTSALILPLAAGGQQSIWRYLFSALLLDAETLPPRTQGMSRVTWLQQVERAAARRVGNGYFNAMKRVFFDAVRHPALILSAPSPGLDAEWREGKRFLHGPAIDPFLDTLDELTSSFALHDWRPIAPHLAETAEASF